MKDETISMQIQQALNAELSFLAPSSSRQEAIFDYATGGKPMKRTFRLSFGLVLVLVILLTAFTAVAAVLLSAQDVIEQNAVPMARENDTDTRIVTEYTPEQLADLIRTANENGITLDETTGIMQALRRGEGYWEDEAIMEICRQAFGGLFYEWTIEEKHWFTEILSKTGNEADDSCPLPDEEDLTTDEARQRAVALLQAEYPGARALEEKGLYRREEWLSKEEGDTEWQFRFSPMDLEHPLYAIVLNKAGEADSMAETPQNWESYSYATLMEALYRIYRSSHHLIGDLPQEGWHQMRDMLEGAEHDRSWGIAQDAYLASVYPLPKDGEITLTKAREIAREHSGSDAVSQAEGVLLGDGDKRIWKITLSFLDEKGQGAAVAWEIDAESGSILGRYDLGDSAFPWRRYVLESTYERFVAGMLTVDQAGQLAADALRSALNEPDIPYADPAFFEQRVSYYEWRNSWSVSFRTKTLHYANAACTISEPDHQVEITNSAPSRVDGDSLYQRYWHVYGGGNWDQQVLMQFARDMAQLEPTGWEGKLLKKTGFPSEDKAKITREQAVDIAALHNEVRVEEELTSALLGSDEHPIWKITLNGKINLWIYEIDGLTGEVLDKEVFKPDNSDFDPPLKRRTLHRDFVKAYVEEFGMERLAAVEISKAFGDLALDDPELPLLNAELYAPSVAERTVTFRALTPGEPSFRIVFTPDWMTEKAEKL